ncbi:hypothetical protein [Rugamonas sp.]|uniref:hypothetical protein n=1 Tax=Rugamonas sp. TaxID=1926287 RepID=UPI0025F0767A|nr:hypothetical protein [Rugamonas sp.]
MDQSTEQTASEDGNLNLREALELRKDIAEFGQEMKTDFGEVNLILDRVDGHMGDMSEILKRSHLTLDNILAQR